MKLDCFLWTFVMFISFGFLGRERMGNARIFWACVLVVLTMCGAFKAAWQSGFDAGATEAGLAHKEAAEKAAKAAEKIKEQDSKKEKEIVYEYVEKERVIYRDGETVIREIPVYIKPENDGACTINLGFVSMYDSPIDTANLSTEDAAARADAASATAADALPIPEWVENKAGVFLTKVAEVNSLNASNFRLLKARHEKLAHWASTQCYGLP